MISTTTLYNLLVSQGHKPCEEDWDKVLALWPETIPLTEQSVQSAIEADIDLYWLVQVFPTSIENDYEAKMKPILDEYWAKIEPINADYEAKMKPILDEYWAKRQAIWADYQAKQGLLILECLKQMLGL